VSAALQEAAKALIVARFVHEQAQSNERHANVAAIAFEKALIDAYLNDESGGGGKAIICNGYALLLAEEYWDAPAGKKFSIHKVFGAAS
jgi:hypothetical protein